MRILLVSGKFPQLTFIFRMVEALAARGHQVTVAARARGDWNGFEQRVPLPPSLSVRYLMPDSGLSEPSRALGLIGGLPVEVARSPKAAYQLWRACHSRTHARSAARRQFLHYLPFLNLPRPDVVQYEFLPTCTLYPLLGELLQAPTVVSCRGADVHLLEQLSPEAQAMRINCLQHASAVHCVSEELAGEVRRISGRQDDVWVNRPAVPAGEIPAKQDYGGNDPPLIVSVGRLEWKKGYDYLLAALSRVKQAGLAFKARIVGSGALYAKLRFSVEDLGLADEVELVGGVPSSEVLRMLQAADLFVLSSHEEGISNAVLEAMAAGLPIVTTNAGGMEEAVRDGVEGYVVPVRDIAALADRIGRLVTDGDLRRRMGVAARARCEADFSLERQVARFEQIYEATVDRYRQRG